MSQTLFGKPIIQVDNVLPKIDTSQLDKVFPVGGVCPLNAGEEIPTHLIGKEMSTYLPANYPNDGPLVPVQIVVLSGNQCRRVK